MKIYIACGLTHVPRETFVAYTAFIHGLANALKATGAHHVTYALVNSDPQLAEKPFDERARLCYLWDREFVRQADLITAEVSYPSLGVGIELQTAASIGKPIILCFRKAAEIRAKPVEYENPDHIRHALQIGEGYVSLMALGLPTIFRVIDYAQEQEALRKVLDAVHIVALEDGSRP
jgi:hypothetical protein